jgi:hypothetical protein
MTVEELKQGARKVAKDFYSPINLTKKTIKIILTTKRLAGIIPAGTNFSFRRYYKRDFGF